MVSWLATSDAAWYCDQRGSLTNTNNTFIDGEPGSSRFKLLQKKQNKT
ncbi:uncharacterized protein G2W53_043218 [Senna tora]|uniref:Uncharacterized protein n=1 Tax=Senna tora TaxID=362788 RepID=A0A834SNM4_9FABA|nr:uncharacterized protein G2W53_043218 [Senna tora]